MTLTRSIFLILIASLVACGGSSELTCDEGSYKKAVRGPQVDTPADLDGLDPLKEMPLPSASPREDRPEGAPCLDMPPTVIGS
ncbi:MAG: hypothetical protein OEM85_01395 [Gammaproteobacteria bacterium]|nr:hypothetical protein [Gammaproteobacteria bacterium]MDH3372010.1 hypothetical protein [Gammaproteobacteria bacterium]MDH3408546.1 hypothetical protein [Gammaproteobacteria bacterium]